MVKKAAQSWQITEPSGTLGIGYIWYDLFQNWTGNWTRIFCSQFFLCRWRFKNQVCGQTQPLAQAQSVAPASAQLGEMEQLQALTHRGTGATSQVPAPAAHSSLVLQKVNTPRDVLPLQFWEWHCISAAGNPPKPSHNYMRGRCSGGTQDMCHLPLQTLPTPLNFTCLGFPLA